MPSLSTPFARILIFFLIFALRLSTAATIVRVVCHASYGTGMRSGDCAEALRNYFRGPFTSDREQFAKPVSFSRGTRLSPNVHRVPLTLVGPKCSIGVDLIDPAPPSMPSSYALLFTVVVRLIKECVGKSAVGGKVEYMGFEYLIVNPEANQVKGTCLAPHHPPNMSLSRCLESRARRGDQPLSYAGSSDGPGSEPQDAGAPAQGAKEDEPRKRPRLSTEQDPSTLPPRKRPIPLSAQGLSVLRSVSAESNLPPEQQQLAGASGAVSGSQPPHALPSGAIR